MQGSGDAVLLLCMIGAVYCIHAAVIPFETLANVFGGSSQRACTQTYCSGAAHRVICVVGSRSQWAKCLTFGQHPALASAV
jgi:hypothetical protein